MKPISKYKVFLIVIAIIVVTIMSYLIIQNQNEEKNKISDISISENELDIVFGQESAELTIFLFSSYNCSFCRKFFTEVYPLLKQDYIDRGKVKLVLKPVELSSDESILNSLKVAVCVNEYGNFGKLHELLITEPTVVYTPEFKTVINEFIEKDIFVAECMLGGKSENYISNNLNIFVELNLKGTPTFIIHNTIYKGYKDYGRFKKIVEKELNNTL